MFDFFSGFSKKSSSIAVSRFTSSAIAEDAFNQDNSTLSSQSQADDDLFFSQQQPVNNAGGGADAAAGTGGGARLWFDWTGLNSSGMASTSTEDPPPLGTLIVEAATPAPAPAASAPQRQSSYQYDPWFDGIDSTTSRNDGVTILNSVPSSQIRQAEEEKSEIRPPTGPATQPLLMASSSDSSSLTTTSTQYGYFSSNELLGTSAAAAAAAAGGGQASSTTSFSVSPSAVASASIPDLSISQDKSEEESKTQASDVAAGVGAAASPDDPSRSWASFLILGQYPFAQAASRTNEAQQEAKDGDDGEASTVAKDDSVRWYGHYKDQDWEQFQAHAIELLKACQQSDSPDALSHHVTPEELLAQLIQQEEALFWQHESARTGVEDESAAEVRRAYFDDSPTALERRRKSYQRGYMMIGQIGMYITGAVIASTLGCAAGNALRRSS